MATLFDGCGTTYVFPRSRRGTPPWDEMFPSFADEERPFPLDAVSRVIEADGWANVAKGVTQRVQALERFLADVYGPQLAVRGGVIPAALISTSNHFHRQAAGILVIPPRVCVIVGE
ncbi:MAG: circularly permuted type 2 ATP-grasp protein [Actinomycetales bacterium]|nr:circularly permuted type 2 ATP-grasp protein [Actinomycetales bacterium]